MDQLKSSLYQACLKNLQAKRTELAQQLGDITESMQSEQKSPLGDKHETARARMQAEEEGLKKQLGLVEAQLTLLQRIDLALDHKTAAQGSCVVTDKGIFFLSVPLGRIRSGDQEFYAISKDSPLGQLLLGVVAGETRRHQQMEYKVISIL